MEWFNASVTFLQSAEFRRARMEQRGVWLTLMAYCIQQENGGRLEGVETWEDWDWQNVLGVAKKLASGDCFLWQWLDGGSLQLEGYPVEKEAEIRAKREAGKRGGLSSGLSRAASSASSTPSSSAARTPRTERKGKEGNRKGREEKERGGADAPGGSGPLLSVWLTHAAEAYPDWPEAEASAAWAHYDSIGWRNASGLPIISWQSCVTTCHARWSKDPKKISEGGRAAGDPGFDPAKPNAHTGGLPVFETATEVAP